MKESSLVKALLLVSGIIGIGIGGALLFAPVAFEASANIVIEENSNLLSELRASGGTLFAAGILMLSGAFVYRMTYTSIVLSTLFYLSYGLSRVFSIIIDGVPGETLVIATVAELIIGFLSLFVLIKWIKNTSK
ncbi:MAG: DUF4345 domain-containing protein [Cytophagaceae bacterium]